MHQGPRLLKSQVLSAPLGDLLHDLDLHCIVLRPFVASNLVVKLQLLVLKLPQCKRLFRECGSRVPKNASTDVPVALPSE